MTVRLLAIAEVELHEAIAWYDAQARGLGQAFLVEALKTLRLIDQHPEAWSTMTGIIRRCRLARFPYAVIYAPDNSDIVVLAVAHMHRAPMYWKDRVSR